MIAEQTVERIAAKPDLAQRFAASLVAAMARSSSFAQTDAIWKHLREPSSLDGNLCSQLLQASKNNNQIYWATSRLDSGEVYSRVIIDFLRRQPGGAVIASHIDAYAAYLDAQEAELKRREAGAGPRLVDVGSSDDEPPF
jgi:hypothetical protein